MTYSTDLRLRCIKTYSNNMSLRSVGNTFMISKSSIHNWIKKGIETIKKRNRKSRVNLTIINIIKSTLDINPFFTLKNIQNMIKETLKIKLSRMSISRILKKINYSRKRVKYFVKRTEEYYNKLKKIRNVFFDEINKLNKDKIVCIDESSFYPIMRPNYGYGKKGIPIRKPIKNYRSVKYSLLMAITNKKTLCYKLYKGSINTKIFKEFMEENVLPNLNKSYIVMDNVPFHHSKCIKKIINESSNNIFYTPPYSPDFNPIENVFSVIKRYVKQNCPDKLLELTKLINISINNDIQEHLLNKLYNRAFTKEGHPYS